MRAHLCGSATSYSSISASHLRLSLNRGECGHCWQEYVIDVPQRICVFASSKIGCSFSSQPIKITVVFNSGKTRLMSSSKDTRPLSTHCKAATAVKSFVADASQNVTS